MTRDGRLSKPSDVSTHRVAMAELDSVAGFALPRLELATGQVALSGSEPFLVHADSASAAEAMLVEGSVDAVFGWVPANAGGELAGGTLQRLEAQGLDKASLSVVWKSSLLRYGPHALRSGLGAELRLMLLAFLTALKGSQPDVYDILEAHRGGGLQRFAPMTMPLRSIWCARSLAGPRKLAAAIGKSQQTVRNGNRLGVTRSAIRA